ncbi:hypothetical protein [Paractinoplanes toevensis]|uniref:Uncharacterized protein n=1 Tax=Paractinoplanes toevensis TaxID=571911 RepID=A0A920BP34_9ACTN|nr:hypothetical protein [Actinoplanes toevensis]GIM96103.1 hypothetical protein Ato02nite_078960 [Actinoplanes toevensis]
MNPPQVTALCQTAADEPEMIELSAEEYGQAVERTLKSLGYTRDQLRRQAEENSFDSPVAFMVWNTIRDHGDIGCVDKASV